MGISRPTKNQKEQISYRINDEIRPVGGTVRIVGEGIESQVVSWERAKQLSDEKQLDLIEISSKSVPFVVRLDDYNKFLYEQKKKAKEKKQKPQALKEIQLKTNISQNDLEIKARKAKEFIEDGDKVKVVLTMKGRELGRREESKKCLYQFITLLQDVASAESMPKDEGNRSTVILRKKK